MEPALLYKRDLMTREHLRGRGIADPAVLRAMTEAPREEFGWST